MSDWLEATFVQYRPKAIAALTRYFRDIEMAEEMFSEACVKAISYWQDNGKPRDPLAWLLSTARNAGTDRLRKTQRQKRILSQNQIILERSSPALPDPDELRDDVLRLLFTCCHPALDRQDQIAMALRIVAGLSVPEIARGFLLKPKTLEQRLTRAKKKIAANPVAFETPSPQERGRRLGEVSLMIYLMFNEGWSTSDATQQIRLRLCEEAIRLSRLMADLFPRMGEQIALVSLLLFQHARRDARLDSNGRLVVFDEQDRNLWDRSQITEAQGFFQKANRIGHKGPFLLQAAIAAEHARAKSAEATDWQLIEAHYAALYLLQPSPVIHLNKIAVQAKTKGVSFALQEMDALGAQLETYRWFHTMRAAFLMQTDQPEFAIQSYERALELGPTEPERAVIHEKIALCREITNSM